MMWMEGSLAEIFGILPLFSVEIEVVHDNGECSGHTWNRWHM
jgi:hypothetical protein